jgi:hypothetical protein
VVPGTFFSNVTERRASVDRTSRRVVPAVLLLLLAALAWHARERAREVEVLRAHVAALEASAASARVAPALATGPSLASASSAPRTEPAPGPDPGPTTDGRLDEVAPADAPAVEPVAPEPAGDDAAGPEAEGRPPGDTASVAITLQRATELIVRAGHMLSTGAYYDSAETLAKALSLTPAQRADAEWVVAETKRELERLRRTPDETGATWEQVQRDGVRMENGARVVDDTTAVEFRRKRVPGTTETFDAAEGRVLAEGRARIERLLDPKQRAAFQSGYASELFGPLPPLDSEASEPSNK